MLQISKGLVRDPRGRRTVMFYSVIVALVLLFAGSTFFDAWLRERPMAFIGYWAVCAWFTLLAVLLAFFDMLLVRATALREKRRLEMEHLRAAAAENRDDQGTR